MNKNNLLSQLKYLLYILAIFNNKKNHNSILFY